MPKGFKAEELLDELTYDFRPHVDAHGITPEPSSEQIEQYNLDYQILLVKAIEAGQVKGLEGEEKVRAGAQVSKESDDALLHAVATLCSDTPSYDQIKALPYRLRRAFLGWITGVFSNPEE